MFGHQSLPSVMYRYGAWEPVEGLEAVRMQMHVAHRYRNAIVRNERNRRDAVNALLRELSPNLVSLDGLIAQEEGALKEARDEIQQASIKARAKVRPKELVKKVQDVKKRLKKLYVKQKTLKKKLFNSRRWEKDSVALEEKYHARGIRLRHASDLFWGTYLHVEQAMSGCKKGPPPQFAHWRGDGHLAVQVQRGMTPEEAFSGNDNRIRLEPMPTEGSKAARKRTRLWFRVGSLPNKQPFWAVIPVCIHRPLPSNARIKWVHLLRKRIAGDDRWEVCFTLSRPEGWAKPDCASDGQVDIDVGWRVFHRPAEDHRPGESPIRRTLRIAYWKGSDGEEGELFLPSKWLQEYEATYGIAAVRKKLFNETLLALSGWLLKIEKPSWLTDVSRTLTQWESPARLSSLAIDWRTQRFPGDKKVFEFLENWRKRNLHLWRYEAHRRDRLQAQRLDLYRNFAAQMRRRYHTANVEEMDFREFHTLPKPEEPPPDEISRRHTRHACVSSLIGALKNSMAKIVAVKPQHTTMRCIRCGHIENFDRKKLYKTCPACGHEEDQDRGAAVNIGRRARASKA